MPQTILICFFCSSSSVQCDGASYLGVGGRPVHTGSALQRGSRLLPRTPRLRALSPENPLHHLGDTSQ